MLLAAEGNGLCDTCHDSQVQTSVARADIPWYQNWTTDRSAKYGSWGLRPGEKLNISIAVSPARIPADGVSTSRITLAVTDLVGQPVGGAVLRLAVAEGNGQVEPESVVTDDNGRAQATFVAGVTPGLVHIVATESQTGSVASAEIGLITGGPAKVVVSLRPETLPADGTSRAAVKIKVTDLFDNPMAGAEVELVVPPGRGWQQTTALTASP